MKLKSTESPWGPVKHFLRTLPQTKANRKVERFTFNKVRADITSKDGGEHWVENSIPCAPTFKEQGKIVWRFGLANQVLDLPLHTQQLAGDPTFELIFDSLADNMGV